MRLKKIFVERGGVVGLTLEKCGWCEQPSYLGLDLSKIEIVGVGGLIEVRMCKSHIGEYYNITK